MTDKEKPARQIGLAFLLALLANYVVFAACKPMRKALGVVSGFLGNSDNLIPGGFRYLFTVFKHPGYRCDTYISLSRYIIYCI